MEPISASIFAYFMVNEILTTTQIWGAILIIKVTLIAEVNLKKRV